MGTSRFFDFGRWKNFLIDNFAEGVLVFSDKGNSTSFYFTEPIQKVIQFSDKYPLGHWRFEKEALHKGFAEETYLTIKAPANLLQRQKLPNGTYLITVEENKNPRPRVTGFKKRGFWPFYNWSSDKFPGDFPLMEILRQDREYFFNNPV